MEEEIDLRPYIELLIKRWYVILGAAILAGLIAFGVTSVQDPVYKATALVAVTQERLSFWLLAIIIKINLNRTYINY